MRELPNIVDRRSLLPVGIAVTLLLCVWAGVRIASSPWAPPPEGAWQIPAGSAAAMVCFAGLVAIFHIVRGASGARDRRNWHLAGALLVDLNAAVLLVVMWQTGRADIAGLARMLAILALWASLWAALDRSLHGDTWTTVAMIAGPALGLVIAWLVFHPEVPPMAGRDTVIGGLMLTWLVGTLATIIWAAGVKSADAMRHVAHGWLGTVLLLDCLGLWLIAWAWDSGMLDAWHVVKLYLLLVGWLGACTAVTLLLRHLGPGIAVAAPVVLCLALLAFPATVVPLHRALPRDGFWAADGITGHAAYGCPTLGALDAVADAVPFSWPQAGGRVMYGLTTLGQDAPPPQVSWWRQMLGMLAVAIGLGGLGAVLTRRP